MTRWRNFPQCVARIKSDAAIKGAVITSGKEAFLAGADLMMVQATATGNPKHTHEQRVDALYASPIIGFSGILRAAGNLRQAGGGGDQWHGAGRRA